MNNFIKVLTEEVLKEDFDIKTLALKFFNKHPTLLKQIQKLACKQSIPQIKLSNYDYSIIKEIYINKNIEKAKQLINSRYKPGDKKFSELIGLINVNEAKNNALLAIGFALALGAGLLSGCAMPFAGSEVAAFEEHKTEWQANYGRVENLYNGVYLYNNYSDILDGIYQSNDQNKIHSQRIVYVNLIIGKIYKNDNMFAVHTINGIVQPKPEGETHRYIIFSEHRITLFLDPGRDARIIAPIPGGEIISAQFEWSWSNNQEKGDNDTVQYAKNITVSAIEKTEDGIRYSMSFNYPQYTYEKKDSREKPNFIDKLKIGEKYWIPDDGLEIKLDL